MEVDQAVHLPHELIIEILSWLPPKSIVRLRSACKLWHSTVCDSKFIQEHQSHFSNSQQEDSIVVFFRKISNDGVEPNLKFFQVPGRDITEIPESNLDEVWGDLALVGSCNGIFSYMEHGISDRRPLKGIMLYNPWTRHTIIVPGCLLVLEIYQLPSPVYACGIGFDSQKNDYKVVTMSSTITFRYRRAAVYSLNSKEWKVIESPVPEARVMGQSVFLNGFIHWLCGGPVVEISVLLLFDVCNEVFDVLQLPESVTAHHSIFWGGISMQLVNGSICVMDLMDVSCDVWMMKKHGVVESWTKLFNLEYKFPLFVGPMTVSGKIIMWSSRGHGEAEKVVVGEDGHPYRDFQFPNWQLWLCDPETFELTKVCRAAAFPNVISFTPTLELFNY